MRNSNVVSVSVCCQRTFCYATKKPLFVHPLNPITTREASLYCLHDNFHIFPTKVDKRVRSARMACGCPGSITGDPTPVMGQDPAHQERFRLERGLRRLLPKAGPFSGQTNLANYQMGIFNSRKPFRTPVWKINPTLDGVIPRFCSDVTRSLWEDKLTVLKGLE